MKNIITLFSLLALLSCNSESSSKSDSYSSDSTESNSATEETLEKKSVAQSVEKKVEDVTSIVHKKLKSENLDNEQKEIKNQQFQESKNKEKSCSDLMDDYEKLINTIVKDKTNLDNLSKLKEWSNDIFHNTCLKDNIEYQNKYAEINKKLG